MDQILWLLLFPAFLHPLNLRIIRQRQPRAPQQPYNNRGTAVHGDNAGGHSQDGTERSWARCWRDQGWTDRRTGCHSHLSDRSGAKGPAADPPVPLLPLSPLLTPGLSRFLKGQCGSRLALERLFPTDRALSTSVFTEKPNKPLEERSQQPGLCQELGQLHLHPGWSRERTNPPSQGTGIAPSWRNCCLCMEQRPWNSCGTNWERGICGVISTPPAAALRG